MNDSRSVSMPTVSVLIPTRNAGAPFAEVLRRLQSGTLVPTEILIADSASTDDTVAIAQAVGAIVEPVTDFNHGLTRNSLAARAISDIIVFMTHDAMPADDAFLEKLVAPIVDGRAIAAYARQITTPDADPNETYRRFANYGPISRLKTQADRDTMGIRALMFSDTASALRRDVFESLGGYEAVNTNEDMLFCAAMLDAGHTVAYEATARVYHTHRESPTSLLRRYIEIGRFMGAWRNRLGILAGSGDGLRFLWGQVQYLIAGRYCSAVPRCLVDTMCKYVGFRWGVARSRRVST
jgi:rhamnosyltransferase